MLQNPIDIKMLARLPVHTWIVTGFSITLLIYNTMLHGGYAVDDAYIGFRFLDNWLNNQGLVFNPQERVEGYTNFLWLVVLAPLRLLGISAETAALVVNLVCLMIVAYSCYVSVRKLVDSNNSLAVTVWALLAGYGSFTFWLTAGMEPLLMTALLCWANMEVLRQQRINAKAALLFSAAVLTRPDAALFAVIAFVFYFPYKSIRDRKAILDYIYNAAIFALPLIFHLLWRWSYYGELLPNTYYAKMHPDSGLMLRFGWAYFERFLWAGGAVFIILVATGLLTKSLWSRFCLMLTAQVFLFCLYIIKVGGDYMLYFRFFIPLIPILSILSAIMIIDLVASRCERATQASLFTSIAVIALSLAMTISLTQSSDMGQAPGVRQAHKDNEIFSAWLSDVLPDNTVLAMNLVGLVPYRTGFKTIDMLGLTDKHIARGKIAQLRAGPGSYIGHFKYDGEYVCRLMPDVMIPTTIMLHPAQSAEQARLQVTNRSYDSDRDFWQTPACQQAYEGHYRELRPNRYAVIYIRKNFLAGAGKTS